MEMKKTRPQVRYSEEFKRMVVEEIEAGIMSISQASRYYGVSGGVSIYKWIALYGMNEIKGKKVVIMSHKEENEIITLRRELALSKSLLEEARLQALAWETMVEELEKELGVELKKKSWSHALQDAKQKLYPEESISVRNGSAGSTDSPNKPDTSGKKLLQRRKN
jgi:transposase-like protein